MEAEQLREIAGGEVAGQEFLRILAEILANSVLQDINCSVTN